MPTMPRRGAGRRRARNRRPNKRATGADESMRGGGKSRRDGLALLAAGAAFAAAPPGLAAETRIARLIRESQAFPGISQRIAFISAALRGTPHKGDTPISSAAP